MEFESILAMLRQQPSSLELQLGGENEDVQCCASRDCGYQTLSKEDPVPLIVIWLTRAIGGGLTLLSI